MNYSIDKKTNNEKKGFWNRNAALITMAITVAALGTSFYIMSTFSRNTSTVTSTDTGTVAKFEYEIKQTEGTDTLLNTSGTNINIFDTVIDSGVPGSGGKILAPGTAGYFEFLFRNKSNSPVKVTFDNLQYSETSPNGLKVPIIFYFNGNYYSDLYDQPLTAGGLSLENKYGRDWKFYFKDGDSSDSSKGIRLTGNMSAFKAALNQFSTNGTGTGADKATSFLSTSSDTSSDYLRLAWFYPFDARLVTGDTTLETGTETGSGYSLYSFDTYNGNFVDGTTTVTMAPIIRTTGVDSFTANTHATHKGFDSTNWQRNDGTNVRWGED